jgi:amino acid transporter
VAPLITWIFLSSVTSSYVAANTQTSRVIFAGARGGLWASALATVNVRFRTPAAAAVAFVALLPSTHALADVRPELYRSSGASACQRGSAR